MESCTRRDLDEDEPVDEVLKISEATSLEYCTWNYGRLCQLF